MPKRRPPNEVWQEVRRIMWARDGGRCQYPYGKRPVTLAEVHIDHVVSGKRGTNKISDLRTLCRRRYGLAGSAAPDRVAPRELRADRPNDRHSHYHAAGVA